MLCTFEKTVELMPEVKPILDELIPTLQYDKDQYLVDVKVHMLMPNEWPCIPNWHRDFVPRDANHNRLPNLVTPEDKMYLWISGAPFTEFREGSKTWQIEPQQWMSFTQMDVHRGTMSEAHTWRCFIRVIPKKFVHPTTTNIGTQRRHSQTYLDVNKFKW
jgi:hypothetical protein